MSIYEGKAFKCGCGKTHKIYENSVPVLRELRGMKVVVGCPDNDDDDDEGHVNLVKIGIVGGFKSLLTALNSV